MQARPQLVRWPYPKLHSGRFSGFREDAYTFHQVELEPAAAQLGVWYLSGRRGRA